MSLQCSFPNSLPLSLSLSSLYILSPLLPLLISLSTSLPLQCFSALSSSPLHVFPLFSYLFYSFPVHLLACPLSQSIQYTLSHSSSLAPSLSLPMLFLSALSLSLSLSQFLFLCSLSLLLLSPSLSL
jgi:hypothetical protein